MDMGGPPRKGPGRTHHAASAFASGVRNFLTALTGAPSPSRSNERSSSNRVSKKISRFEAPFRNTRPRAYERLVSKHAAAQHLAPTDLVGGSGFHISQLKQARPGELISNFVRRRIIIPQHDISHSVTNQDHHMSILSSQNTRRTTSIENSIEHKCAVAKCINMNILRYNFFKSCSRASFTKIQKFSLSGSKVTGSLSSH